MLSPIQAISWETNNRKDFVGVVIKILCLFSTLVVSLVLNSFQLSLQTIQGLQHALGDACLGITDSWLENRKKTEIEMNDHGRPPERIKKGIDEKVADIPHVPLFFDSIQKEGKYDGASRPFLFLSFRTFSQRALVDTGASINLVDNKFVLAYEKEYGPMKWDPCNSKVVAVNDQSLEILGCGPIDVKIQASNGLVVFHKVPVHLVSVETPVLLGSCFLESIQANIDYADKVLRVNVELEKRQELVGDEQEYNTSTEQARQSTVTSQEVVFSTEVMVPPGGVFAVNGEILGNKGSGKYLFQSELPGPDLALCKLENGLMPILVTNSSSTPVVYAKGSIMGHCIPKADADMEVVFDANRVAAGLKTTSMLTMQKSAHCFCQLGRKVAKLVKIFFIDSQFETGFRNVTANNNFGKPIYDEESIIIRGETMYIPSNGRKIGLEELRKKMMHFDLTRDSFVVLSQGLGQLNLDQQGFLAMMSRLSDKITVKYFSDGLGTSLCEEHKPLEMPVASHFEIIILAGKNSPPCAGVELPEFTINEVKVTAWFYEVGNQEVISWYLHFPEHHLKYGNRIRSTLSEAINEARQSQNRHRSLSIALSCTTDPQTNLMWNIVKGAKEIKLPPKCELVPSIIIKGTGDFEGSPKCACSNCTFEFSSTGSYPIISDLTKVEKVAMVQEDWNFGLDDCKFDDQYTLIAQEEYDDIVNPTPIVSEEQGKSSISKMIQRTPASLREWFSKVVDMFPNVIVSDKGKTKLLRDSRLLLKLKLKENVEQKHQVFPASPAVTAKIENLFANLVAQGYAEYTDSENLKFCSPTFVRFKTPDGLNILKRDPTANVPIRLVSNYSNLNKYLQPPVTVLPIIKELVSQVATHSFIMCSDHQQAYRSYALSPESTEWVAISSPSNIKLKMLILLEGLSQGPEHVH